ncbi:MAG: hypothetical protein ABSH20_12080 [Tepidisphaeraceae bacterium]|jgi:hypothetical protein
MGSDFWKWLIHSNGGLMLRVGVGAAIFAAMTVADYRRHGPAARRWREYVFLLAAAGIAILYGLVNDQLTVSISWEYFYYGKGIDQVIGIEPPPMGALRWEAFKIGLKATWTAGLVAGVVLLMANNPSRRRPQLPMKTLYRLLAIMLIGPIIGGIVGGLLGRAGLPARFSAELADLVRLNLWRPGQFQCVYGIHLGGYVGGLAAMVAAAVWIRWKRWRLWSAMA